MRPQWIALGLLLTACETAPQSDHGTLPPSAGEASAQTSALRDHIKTHAQPAASLQVAVAQGRLIDAYDIAATFTGPIYHEELRTAARRIERARDLQEIGSELGTLATACSNCHQTQKVTAEFRYDAAPAEDGTLHGQMHRHGWAAQRLWEGLTGPSDTAWSDGARVLASTKIDVRATVHEVPNPDVFELGERMQAQAREAVDLPASARAAHYSAMMETCTRCHAIARPRSVVGAR